MHARGDGPIQARRPGCLLLGSERLGSRSVFAQRREAQRVTATPLAMGAPPGGSTGGPLGPNRVGTDGCAACQRLARYSTGAVPQIGGVTPSSIPHRWGTKKQDILENFLAGMSVTGIDGHERFKAIKDPSGWTVQQVLSVSRLDGRRGYYLIDIVGREGLPLMTASVDAEGWLVAVVDTSGHTSRRPTPLDVAAAAVSHRAGLAAVRAARHVSGLSTVEPGLPEFAPLARVERVDGIYYVNSAGDVFRQTTDEPSLQRSRPALSVQGRLKRLDRIE